MPYTRTQLARAMIYLAVIVLPRDARLSLFDALFLACNEAKAEAERRLAEIEAG